MKGLAITSKGLEDTACREINELTGSKCKKEEACVIFEFKKFENLCLLCYKAQSVDRILHLIDSFEFKDLDDITKSIKKSSFGDFGKYSNFRVECIRIGEHGFKSIDVEENASKIILDNAKNSKINFKNPDAVFFLYIINSKCYFGIDFSGFELNKREYKIFLHPGSLRGTIAYALIREAGFDGRGILLDPFSRDGVIAIESAFLASGFPVNYFKKEKFAFLKLELGIDCEKFFNNADKKIKKSPAGIYSFDHLFKYVDFSKKNAKIAGVDKQINFSRRELEWLDIKFKKNSVDFIITNPPSSKNANLDKIYNELFYQCEYILKSSGAVALITRIPDFVIKHAEQHNFAVLKEKDVWSGEQLLKIIALKKKK